MIVFPNSPIAGVLLLAKLEKLQNGPFAGFGLMSVYVSFAIGLGRECFGTKGFRVSLSIDFKRTKILFKPLSYLPR